MKEYTNLYYSIFRFFYLGYSQICNKNILLNYKHISILIKQLWPGMYDIDRRLLLTT